MKTTRFLVAGLLGSAATAAFLAAPASAQTTDKDQAAPVVDDDNVIVVTARRREESIQDVPLSITAISGDALTKSGTLEITEIAQEVPNLTLEVSRGTNTTLTRATDAV